MNAKKLCMWLVALGAVALLAAGACKKKDQTASGPADTAAAQTPTTAQAGDANAWYRCPMEECHYAQKGPGKCPTCGMDLVKAPEGWAPADVGDATSCTGSSCGCPMAAGMQGMQGTGAPSATDAKTAKELAPDKIGQQATCPVTGETFTVTEATPAVEYEGKVYLFCCPMCVPKFLENPAKYVGGSAPPSADPAQTPPAADAGAAPAAPAATLEIKTAGELAPERIGKTETCPVGGDSFTVTAESPAVSYDGKVTIFGCMGCAAAFAANPGNPAAPPCGAHGQGST